MHESDPMRSSKSLGDLKAITSGLADGKPTARKEGREALPLHVLHDKKVDVIRAPDVV
jgi:hypothetical protein